MERRMYERIPSKIECIVYCNELTYEFRANIVDISEGGLRIRIGDEIANSINLTVNDNIRFQFVDNYEFLGELVSSCVTGYGRVVRFSDASIGCCLTGRNNEFVDYVKSKKLMLYIQKKG